MNVRVSFVEDAIKGEVTVPGSKSISNRVLIIKNLCKGNFHISNISTADDTSLLARLLNQDSLKFYVGDGGTTSRFLIALLCLREGTHEVVGSETLNKRPIEPLVSALRQLGADIEYVNENNRLPILIKSSNLRGGKIALDSTISSQFISALMLIAPYLDEGLEISLSGDTVSKPYIEMTASIQREFGIEVEMMNNVIVVSQGEYQGEDFTVEGDWSSASFFSCMAAVAKKSEIRLKGLNLDSIQGDRIIIDLLHVLGLKYTIENDAIIIENPGLTSGVAGHVNITDYPDLFPPLAVAFGLTGNELKTEGFENLVYKESNRIESLRKELIKVGIDIYTDEGYCYVKRKQDFDLQESTEFDSHNDHRVAMACSLLALVLDHVTINDAQVVSKSNPGYWDQLMKLGFTVDIT